MVGRQAGRNKFTDLSNLANESDVEQFFLLPLLHDLGFADEHIATKASLPTLNISKTRKKRLYRPDYICHAKRGRSSPRLIVEAKSPNESAEDGVEEAQLYAAVLRRSLPDPKPMLHCLGSNGHRTLLKRFDDDNELFSLAFSEFQKTIDSFQRLTKQASRTALQSPSVGPTFRLTKPNLEAIPGIFEACHKLIWKTEGMVPAPAFYEFAKVMYVKIEEDRKVLSGGGDIQRDKVRFSTAWIDKMVAEGTRNPINDVCFADYLTKLEEKVRSGEKKRIFAAGEGIDLLPSTIYEVVRKLEHYDFHGVDEDLNGRLFETFLTATMRGDLGQYFTPRTVVKHMVRMADLRVSRDGIETVLDGCCGTGGFLIEAMAVLDQKIAKDDRLSNTEKAKLGKELRTEALWGVDNGKEPPIARIARLNMLLHKDGGSRIFFANTLDKEMLVDPHLPSEDKEQRTELQAALIDKEMQFDVVLTNPPFSMKYERNKPADNRILEKYDLAHDAEGKARGALRSAVMFLERYAELLKPGGRLLTIMDESVLNTSSMKYAREFIKDKFVIVAVISLPQNTFAKAGGAVKTSILYLRKKHRPEETQPSVFFAISENVGHDDTGRPTPDKNDLPDLLIEFQKFTRREIGERARVPGSGH